MCWHRWSQWKVTEDGDVTVQGRKVGLWVAQRRVCEKCGKTELDTQTELL